MTKTDYTLLDISNDDYCSLMDDAGNTRDDLKVPEDPDLAKQARAPFSPLPSRSVRQATRKEAALNRALTLSASADQGFSCGRQGLSGDGAEGDEHGDDHRHQGGAAEG